MAAEESIGFHCSCKTLLPVTCGSLFGEHWNTARSPQHEAMGKLQETTLRMQKPDPFHRKQQAQTCKSNKWTEGLAHQRKHREGYCSNNQSLHLNYITTSKENTSSKVPATITFDQVQKQKNYCFNHLLLLNQEPSEIHSSRNKPPEDSIKYSSY